MKRLVLALALLLILGSLVLVGGKFALFSITPFASENPTKLVMEVKKGESPNEITKFLVAEKIVSNGQMMMWLGRLTRKWGSLKAGEYEVSSAMSPREILKVLTSGISLSHPVTVREGENMYEVASEVEAKRLGSARRFLELCRSAEFMKSLGFKAPLPPTLEGYLYPETYFFNRTMTIEDMIRLMVRKHLAVWTPELRERAQTLGLSHHQAITLASMIEKETGAPQERPLISSVFHNRLRKKMRLQSDPTTIYGIWERYDGNLHRADLQAPTPYNTYTVAALPVGPISNPGIEAIRAALYPAESEYLFFVSHNDGTHEFTKTLAEHTRAVSKFQLDPKAREGKSWRDLNKKQTKSP